MCISDVKEYLDCDAKDLHKEQPSRIQYLEVVDKNPDSHETMTVIAEDLLEKFDNEVQNGWVILLGDVETYQHLMNIK